MFDFAWSEIALIGVVALVLIGPKDMPVAIKAVSDMVRKARKMAGEFQTHVDEMTKDTGIAEVRKQIAEIRNMDIGGEIARAVDGDGSIRAAFKEDPFTTPAPGTASTAVEDHPPLPEVEVSEAPAHSMATPAPAPAQTVAAPAFVPPAFVPPAPVPPAAPAFVPPAFVPPSAAPSGAAHPDAAGAR